MRDPTLEDVEANRVGERINVVSRADVSHNDRVPTNLVSEDERSLVDAVTRSYGCQSDRIIVQSATCVHVYQ